MDLSLSGLIQQAMDALNQGGALGQFTFFSVVTLTEVGIPFPYLLDSGVFLTSYQSGPISVQMFRILLVVFLGRQFGAAIVYWLTRWLGGRLIRSLERRFASLRKNLDRFSARLSNQAYMTVAGTRLTGLLTLVSMAAGACRIRYLTFFIGVTLSAVIFDGSLVMLGWITRQGFHYLRFTPPLWAVIAGFIVVIIVVWVVRYFFFTDRRSRA
jgi:membrane protein DedA with SNARE-associated domain